MASRIDHGAPGSFKSFALVQRFGIPALQEGRVVVTNIRGFNSLERVKKNFPKINFPDTAKLIYVSSESKTGRLLMAGFFHWIPFGSLVLMDEAQRIYPKRLSFKLESLNRPITPEGYIPEQLPQTNEHPQGIPRPEDVFNAFDMQRHYQWDIYLSTPNIAKIQPIIREVCVTAFLHKSLGEKLPFLFKNTWYEFQHDAENNGKTLSNRIGTPDKYKADERVFQCYDSTATGQHTQSKADKSILSDNGVRFKLAVILLAICTAGFFLFRFSQLHQDTKPVTQANSKNDQTINPQTLPLPLQNTEVHPNPPVSHVTPNDDIVQNPDIPTQLGYNLLALSTHDLKDPTNHNLSFIVSTKHGLKKVSYQNLRSYGYEVYTHALCHITLKDSHRHTLNLTCEHPDIDKCTLVIKTNTTYIQNGCINYSTQETTKKPNNTITTATNFNSPDQPY